MEEKEALQLVARTRRCGHSRHTLSSKELPQRGRELTWGELTTVAACKGLTNPGVVPCRVAQVVELCVELALPPFLPRSVPLSLSLSLSLSSFGCR